MLKRYLPLLILGAACQKTRHEALARSGATREAAPPMKHVGNAYEAAGVFDLPEAQAADWDDLHNVRHLGDRIISGSEPHGEKALERIREMGVKTLVSVDGKVPDAATAEKLGMRYVHIPIQYKGLKPEEIAKLAKTFRELEGPFYVHCFHGKHRGPAGAAVGRLVLDGVSRDHAIAEMRQCGAASKYEGLYQDVATAEIPTTEQSRRFRYDFAPAAGFAGFRQAMIRTSRHYDHLALLAKSGWKTDPAHPDLDPGNESSILHAIFESSIALDEMKDKPADFMAWMHDSLDAADLLQKAIAGGDAVTANRAFAQIKKTCGACHASYRND